MTVVDLAEPTLVQAGVAPLVCLRWPITHGLDISLGESVASRIIKRVW